jgi:NodT family efflux transporter outer membrane factor (OMF) lipoprotein
MPKKKREPSGKNRMGEIFSKSLLGLIALVFLTGGCAMVGPNYVKPPVQEPKEWMEKEDPQIKSEPTDFGEWWKLFNDPVLDSLIETAYQQNLPLRIAGIRILEARARLGIATGTLYPQQQVGVGSYTRTSASTTQANFPPGFDSSFSNYGLSFDAAWELDFWGRFRRAVQSSLGNLEATIADYDDTLVTLSAEVARTYVVIRTLEERLVVARENVKIQERSVQIARVRFEGGDVSELDVTQATSLLKDTQALIPRLEGQLRQTKNALAILLGMLPGEIQAMLSGPELIPTVPAEVAVSVPAELLRRRPDIRGAERQMASQSARIGVAKSNLYPHFVLFGSIGISTANSSDFFDSDSIQAFGGPGVTWDLFNYGRIRNRVRVQDALFQQLIVNYENTVLQAAQEVEDAIVAFLRTQEEAKFLAGSVAASKRAVDLSMLQYREGLADYQRVLDSQRSLTIAQDNHTVIRGSVVTNLVALYKALGGGWEARIGKEFVPEEIKEEMEERTNWGNLLTPATHEKPTPEEEQKLWRSPEW